MYVPRFNAVADDAEIRRLVATVGAGELITTGPDGYPLATRLPLVWDGDRVLLHMALANPHWRSVEPDSPALLVVTAPEAYVSPAFYPSKAEHGRVVPTWNYSAVQIAGRLTVHTDPAWKRAQVALLTDTMEAGRTEPWAVDDAPATYVDQQLKAIVGLELAVEQVAGKAKLSQNRSAADQAGVVAGLRATGRPRDLQVADAMDRLAGD
ncbi:FMN-binding negative transcriptional regulator [Nocardioides sp. CER19]|uniref:FMN-binding negative transcriptional regulator n=1 Tax=Nocardioides sp. CER19 TaxID=3038538 RepID=UPI0024498B3B|nr:FMN-binding negative transcriptional regulator [Nocardioides sp. CER19]MDH2413618.1 FMN-binding negative transcriptional regulator [Nocardioides sp. CER19]